MADVIPIVSGLREVDPCAWHEDYRTWHAACVRELARRLHINTEFAAMECFGMGAMHRAGLSVMEAVDELLPATREARP